ncbi:hypothetical protein O3P69_010915 [Scylla paramamosain]|uniref:Uncharacterized protein n=1 Tax=Scylla paramamosain TaxID=85552 RepID=A0AAW0SDC7_SCYPA
MTPPESRNCQSNTSQEAMLLGCKKKFTFRKLFDHSLQKMQESSLMNKVRTNWLSAGTSTCGRKTKFTASLSDVAAIFILLMGDAAFSCLLLMLLLLLLEYAHMNRVTISHKEAKAKCIT